MSSMDMDRNGKAGNSTSSTPSRMAWVKPEVRTEDMSNALTGGSNWLNPDSGNNCGS